MTDRPVSEALLGERCPRCNAGLIGYGRVCRACGRPVQQKNGPPKPAPAIPDTRSEEEIEHGIMATLGALGFAVAKLSQPRATMQTEGCSDLIVFGFGVTVFAEIKRGDGEQSANQRRFERWVRMGGGDYRVWRSEAEALEWAKGVMSEERAG